MAFRTMVSKTGWRSVGELPMTRRMSLVAVCFRVRPLAGCSWSGPLRKDVYSRLRWRHAAVEPLRARPGLGELFRQLLDPAFRSGKIVGGEAVMTTRASHATCPYSGRLLAPASRIGRTRYGGTMECPVGAQRAALPLVSTAGAIGPAGRRRRRPLLKHRNSRCDHYGSVGHGSSAGRIHRML